MSEQNYISRQITVYKTDKKLIEFIDKLKAETCTDRFLCTYPFLRR